VWNLVGNLLRNSSGFSLVESIVASMVLIVAIAGLAPLFVQSARSAADGRRTPVTLAAASSKLEQLLALAWTYDLSGMPVSDLTADTSRDPPAPGGGTGLSLSPDDSLTRAAPGFVDYIDGSGRSVGPTPGNGALYSRRWLIQPWPGASSDVLVIRVCVVRITGTDVDLPPEVCLGTARMRQ